METNLSYDMYVPTRVMFGAGMLNKLSEQPMPGKRAMIVISNGKSTRANGYLSRTEEQLHKAGVETSVFDGVMPNPTVDNVNAGAAMARESGQNDRLTVITSAFSVASELSTRRSVDVIQLGGMVRRSSLSVLGPFAEQMLGSLSCSKLFMGVDGVDLDYGVTTTNHIEASLHKQMIASVQKVIVLADSSKFGRRGFSKICDMSAVDQIITDDKAPASVIERLQESGVDVTVVPVGRRE